MDQLTINDILALCARLRGTGMTMEEIKALPIYLGNDDELNGIHTGWALDFIDANNTTDDDEWMVEMINEDSHNIELDGKAVVIS
jgi:hypothetical protein